MLHLSIQQPHLQKMQTRILSYNTVAEQTASPNSMLPQASGPSSPQQPLEDQNVEPLATQISSLDLVTDQPSHRNFTKSSAKVSDCSPKHSLLRSQRSSGHESDAGSTSTWEYGQEAFEIYKLKVAELCRKIGRREPSELERTKGGSFNRAIGVELREGKILKCVFRIPRCPLDDEQAIDIKDQVTVLIHLSQFDFLHVPSIIAYDTTPENATGDQYVLQERLPGVALQDVFYDLSMSEKSQITTLVAELLIKMESITLPKPGQLNGDRSLPRYSHHAPSPAGIAITGFRETPMEDIPAFEKQHLASLLIVIFEYKKEKAGDCYRLVYMLERLHDIVRDMMRAGLMRTTDSESVIWHWDISARNILIDRVASRDQQLDNSLAAEPGKDCQHQVDLKSRSRTRNTNKRSSSPSEKTPAESAILRLNSRLRMLRAGHITTPFRSRTRRIWKALTR